MQRTRKEPPNWERVEPVADWLNVGLESRAEDFVRVRQYLHTNPELSGQERETTAFLTVELDGTNLTTRQGRDGLGLIADLKIGNPNENTPLIAVRADIDALPLPDKKGKPYSSRHQNVTHACGHDAHASIALGTARLFSKLQTELTDVSPDFAARLRFIFQPAEEICAGAQWMIEQGALEGVSAILGLHLEPQLRAGEVGIRYGVMTAYCDELAVTIEGQGGHSARPHLTTDPIATATQLISLLYTMLPRNVDSRDAAVFSVGTIHGGKAPNIIPDRVEFGATLRTTDPDARRVLKQKIRTCCETIAAATGNQIEATFSRPLIAVVNDESITGTVQNAATQIVGEDKIHLIKKPSLGGEDFALYVNEVPGCMFRLGCAGADEWPPLHSPHFDIDESCLTVGAGIFARTILLLSQTL
jgi:amidohydrolase